MRNNTIALGLEDKLDIKLYYGIFNHDGHEDESLLKGGKQLQMKLSEEIIMTVGAMKSVTASIGVLFGISLINLF